MGQIRGPERLRAELHAARVTGLDVWLRFAALWLRINLLVIRLYVFMLAYESYWTYAESNPPEPGAAKHRKQPAGPIFQAKHVRPTPLRIQFGLFYRGPQPTGLQVDAGVLMA